MIYLNKLKLKRGEEGEDLFLYCLMMLTKFVTVAAIVLALQWYLVKHEKRGRWILPVLITIFAVIFSAHGQWWYHSSSGISEILVWDDHEYVGVLQTAIDEDRHMRAVGRLVIGETEEELDYIDLEFDSGKMIGTKKALKYEAPIMEALGRSAKDFTGSSVSYKELEREQEHIAEPVRGEYNWQGFAQKLIFTSVVPIVAWIMVCRDFRKKRKQKQLRKMQITDL